MNQTRISARILPLFVEGNLLLLALITSLPVLVIFAYLFVPDSAVWIHLVDTVLVEYLINSLLLVVAVAIGVLLLGIPTAWLTSMCEFPGRFLFEWALLLPMAIPAYIIAYSYTGMLDFSGPVQTLLREWTGWGYGDYWFPEIRSLQGAALMLSLVLYPYVYLLTRAAFLEQSICVLEVSRTLGCSYLKSFFRVAIPLARPAIITGLSLALMETLADFGTVQYFGVSAFTTGIFRTWYGMGNSAAAAQLSALLMGFVFVLVILESWSRRKARYHHTTNKYAQIRRLSLTGKNKWLAVVICLIPLLFGFLFPALMLFYWVITTAEEVISNDFIILAWHSVLLALAAAFFALIFALCLGYGKRLYPTRRLAIATRIVSLGYAAPGTVIAIGIIIPFAWLDQQLNQLMQKWFGLSPGLMLNGTLFTLLFAYNVRFLAVSLQTVSAGLGRIKPTMDNVARSLGHSSLSILGKIHMPLMKGSVLTATLLVFVDVLKELPATLILRPFDFNTLAVRAYEMASDERLSDAGLPALIIVAMGIIPVILLSYSITRVRSMEQ